MARYQEDWSEERLSLDMQMQGAEAAAQVREAATFEAIFRLREAVNKNAKASDALANSIWWLTVWLLVFTAAIFALTIVLSWHDLKKLWGIG